MIIFKMAQVIKHYVGFAFLFVQTVNKTKSVAFNLRNMVGKSKKYVKIRN